MDAELLQYTTGEEIQVGDRVQYGGIFATVVVVSRPPGCRPVSTSGCRLARAV